MLVEIATVTALGGAANNAGVGPAIDEELAVCLLGLFLVTETLTSVLTCWHRSLCYAGDRRAGGSYRPSWWREKRRRLGGVQC
jgi:hypothetical protein